jgi:restriction endonuclease S subunit
VSEENELPDGWVWTTLGDVGRWSGGGTPSKAKEQFWADGNIPWVSPKDMKTLRIIDTEDHLSSIALEETSLKLCPVGNPSRSSFRYSSANITRCSLSSAINNESGCERY